MEEFFFLDFHQDNVISDLADTFPGNDKFAFPAEKPEEAAGTGNDQGCETVGLAVKFHIYGTAQAAAGTDVDDFFLL